MSNLQQAPVLCFNSDKMGNNDGFYQLPQSIMDILFSKLGGVDGNSIKLMIVLLGTKPGFRISQKWILERTGMTKDAYYKARQKLVKIGLLETTDNEIIVNIKSMLGEYPQEYAGNIPGAKPKIDEYAGSIPSGMLGEYPRVCSENTEGYAGTHTIIYNNIEENIEEIDNGYLDSSTAKSQNQKEEEKEDSFISSLNLTPSQLQIIERQARDYKRICGGTIEHSRAIAAEHYKYGNE